MKNFAVNIRTPEGRYITLTVLANCASDAASAASEMSGGGTVNWVRQLD